MVFGVQWFLLNADVMPGRGGGENETLSSLTFLIFLHNLSQIQLILFIKKETGEQKQMSGFNETVSGGPRWYR